jgi:pimeloyl-ACP methyl ester carboxylesterase
MTEPRNDQREQFERSRLALFAAHGLEGRSRRIADPAGRETYAIVRGDGGCPTVLVHGGVGGTEWALLAGLLKGPLVIPDRPGFGLSYPIDYRKVDIRSDASAWLLNLVDGLGVEKINLVGASMGGLFAMAFAAAHPQRLRRLSILGAPAGLFRDFPFFLRLWGNPVLGPLISRLKISDIETLRKRVFSGYVVYPEQIPSDVLEVALAGTALPPAAFTTHTILNAVTTVRGLRPELLMREEMARLEVPTRFVWGDQDRVAAFRIGDELARRMSDGKFTLIEDAGHLPQLDQPEAVAEAMNPELEASELP